MSSPLDSSGSWSGRKLGRAAQVVVVSSVMFTFISYWRTAAVVLCDMSSTVYYIGAIVESAIGKAAPWFILAVLLFSYGMRSVYIESCSLFVRGGVYRVVKEAMGGFLAKLVRFGAAVRLRADRTDQRRVGRAVHRRSGAWKRCTAYQRASFDDATRDVDQATGARWPLPARSRCTSCGRTCSAFTNRAARR